MNTTPVETIEPTDPMDHPSSEPGDEPASSSSETKHGGRNYWRFAVATFVGSLGRLLVTLGLVGGLTSVV